MSTTTRVQVGTVGVDSGQIMVIDPCYVLDGGDYDAACNASLQEAKAGQMILGTGALRQGVCTSTGIGDGGYPVYVEYVDLGDWGRRVKSITVEFIADDEEWDEDE